MAGEPKEHAVSCFCCSISSHYMVWRARQLDLFCNFRETKRSRAGRYKACSRSIVIVVCTKRTFIREPRSPFCEFQVWNYWICLYIKVGICFTPKLKTCCCVYVPFHKYLRGTGGKVHKFWTEALNGSKIQLLGSVNNQEVRTLSDLTLFKVTQFQNYAVFF